MLDIRYYKTVWMMGHKIHKAMSDRDSHHKLAGLIEMDDSYFRESKAGFAKMTQVESLDGSTIRDVAMDHLTDGSTVKTDGWRAYRSGLNGEPFAYEYVVLR
jgi:hypothetical protein